MRYKTLFSPGSVVLAVLCSSAAHAATFTVADGDVAGFKAAIQAANLTLAADTIALANDGDYSFTTYHATANPLNRTALPIITTAITIEGNGSVVRRADSIAQPIPNFRLFRVSASGALTLRSTTVRNGYGYNSADESDSEGGALRNDGGTLVIEDCSFEHNRSEHFAAGIYTKGPTQISDSSFIDNKSGVGVGAIRAIDISSILIERSHFSENNGDETIEISNVDDAEIVQCSVEKAGDGGDDFGMGIGLYGSVARVANCTITDGSSTGIYIASSSVTVTHCTITEHGQANRPGSGITMGSGFLSLRNSILAHNYNGPAGYNVDCKISGGILLQNTRNLIMDGSCSPAFSGDPKLSSLGFHGGNTKTFPLIEGSKAIDNGNDSVSEAVDQRGVARPIGAHCDIGAYEGSVLDTKRWRIRLPLLYNPEPYIVICDPLPDEGLIVSVLGSREFAVRSINTASLTMGNARPGSARVLGIRDVNRDGIEDLTVEFQLAEVYAGAFNPPAVTLLEMQGLTRDGDELAGYVNVMGVQAK